MVPILGFLLLFALTGLTIKSIHVSNTLIAALAFALPALLWLSGKV